MKHILFIVTSADKTGAANHKTGYEFSEVADPYLEFIKAGYTVDFASINGGCPPEDGYDENHKNSKLFKNSAGFKRLNFSHKLEAIDIDAYDAIFFPGGLGPMVDLADNQPVKSIIAKVYESGKIVAAVCHGPVALLKVKLSNGTLLLEGKKVTSFTEQEEEAKGHLLGAIIPFMLDKTLKQQGAIFSAGKPFGSHVVVDGNLITGQNPASAINVAKEIIKKIA
ncbi:MAG: type 1 glutamine amidotransferase domain-containing protein [Sphingobacteriales bacterium]